MLDLPFFEPHHQPLVDRLERVVATEVEPRAVDLDQGDTNRSSRELLGRLGAAGLLELVATPAAEPNLRGVCLAREAIAAASAAADAVFAVQGLAAYPLGRAARPSIAARYLPGLADGSEIGAFALTEPEAGSDIRSLTTTAVRDGDEYRLDGTKTLISNAGIATLYVLFAKVPSVAEPNPAISAFVVPASTPGLRVTRSIPLLAPHPIGEVTCVECRVPADHRLGAEGEGYQLALTTLDFFRSSVGAAACGLASRALRETLDRVGRRRQFGRLLADFQATRFALADMQAELDAARLLVYRAAWLHDRRRRAIRREASIAKLYATEAAQRVVDAAVQLHGGSGVVRGAVVERLYREVRALRIYEGTSQIQRLIIADRMLDARPSPPPDRA